MRTHPAVMCLLLWVGASGWAERCEQRKRAVKMDKCSTQLTFFQVGGPIFHADGHLQLWRYTCSLQNITPRALACYFKH